MCYGHDSPEEEIEVVPTDVPDFVPAPAELEPAEV